MLLWFLGFFHLPILQSFPPGYGHHWLKICPSFKATTRDDVSPTLPITLQVKGLVPLWVSIHFVPPSFSIHFYMLYSSSFVCVLNCRILRRGDCALSLDLPQPSTQFLVHSDYPVTVGQVGKKFICWYSRSL